MVKMKGVFFTAITFIIFLGVLAYIMTVTSSNVERGTLATDRISANRIYYTWRSIFDNFEGLLNMSIGRSDSTAEFNDSLPAEMDIKSMMWRYQKFIEEFYNDGTMFVRFEDAEGNPVDLNETEPRITIRPMNINYSWPNYGKNRLYIQVDPSNFSFVEDIDIYIKLKNVEINCNISEPGSCNNWNPDSHVESCSGVEYCLTFNLTFEDMNNNVFNFPEKYFDIDNSPPEKSVANLDVKNETASYFIKIQAGSLPTIIDIDLKSVKVDSYTKLKLNTTEFYINYAAILNITTPYGRMVGNL